MYHDSLREKDKYQCSYVSVVYRVIQQGNGKYRFVSWITEMKMVKGGRVEKEEVTEDIRCDLENFCGADMRECCTSKTRRANTRGKM